MSTPRVVVDTNIILVSLTSHSRWHTVYRALQGGIYTLVVSNEIISEYAEKILSKYDRITAENFLRSLLTLPNVEFQEIYYRWNLINVDADDNNLLNVPSQLLLTMWSAKTAILIFFPMYLFPPFECLNLTNLLRWC